MEWRTIENIARSMSEPGMPPQYYLKRHQVAGLIGMCPGSTGQFLADNNVPYHRIGRDKSYFLPDVMEAVERRKWVHNPAREKQYRKRNQTILERLRWYQEEPP